jgi:hypothetical protein
MSALRGSLVDIDRLTDHDTRDMYALFERYYVNTRPGVFLSDLAEKDACIMLRDSDGVIRGFSTQLVMSVRVGTSVVHGVFSGDTIIDREHWGSPELFRAFARHFVGESRPHRQLYWFLTSKGYKTYQMLPLFFRSFYPRADTPTPDREQQIMDAYATARYGRDYDPHRGVVAYRGVKDALRTGVADITDARLGDRHIRHFLELNPGHIRGEDLVCLTELAPDNLKPTIRQRLLGA